MGSQRSCGVDPEKEARHPLKDGVLFSNQIHGLSLLDAHGEPGPLSFGWMGAYMRSRGRWRNASNRRHLALLDGLALLLVRKPGEVIATAMKTTARSFTLYWARGDDLRPRAERRYIKEIFLHARKGSDRNEILAIVIHYTRAKIVSRCRKLLDAVCHRRDESNILNINTNSKAYHELEIHLREVFSRSQDESLADHLDTFVKWLAQSTTLPKHPSVSDLVFVVQFAWTLCCGQHNIIGLVDKRISKRFQKLADYLFAVNRLTHDLDKLNKRSDIRNFEFQQVQAQTPPYEQTVQGPVVAALNTWAAQHHLTPISSFAEVKRAYHHAQEGPQGTTSIHQHQHPEMTLATHLLRDPAYRLWGGEVEIGASKSVCYCCQTWLDAVNIHMKSNQLSLQVLFTETEGGGKRKDGWVLPKLNKAVEKRFLDTFVSALNIVFERLARERWEEMEAESGHDRAKAAGMVTARLPKWDSI